MTLSGMVLSVSRFSVDDGPGIRTVIFLKGCPLKCIWCSTPEGQKEMPELMHFKDKCTLCKKCSQVCPQKALKITEEGLDVQRQLCTVCGTCVGVCLYDAMKIAGRKMSVDEIVEEVQRDVLFYQTTGGGVTLSGGEPLYQADFSAEILKRCKQLGINTAIETCAFGEWEAMRALIELSDFVFFDVKHMLPKKHLCYTGVTNYHILENIRRAVIGFRSKKFTIRVPIVPGYTDTIENLCRLSEFVTSLPYKVPVQLLPYHRLGVVKYYALGRNYKLKDIVPPTHDQLARVETILKSLGVVTVGRG